MSIKQKTLELAAKLNATQAVPYFDDLDYFWLVDFYAPEGFCWVANGEHATADREFKLTDCWKSAFKTMSDGLEICKCYECR